MAHTASLQGNQLPTSVSGHSLFEINTPQGQENGDYSLYSLSLSVSSLDGDNVYNLLGS